MNDQEFLNFLQKQKDMEDEGKQWERKFAVRCLAILEKKLRKGGMSLDQWKSKLREFGKTDDIAIIKEWERKAE